jgi:prepilin-type processing-associated H-X9-DG protein
VFAKAREKARQTACVNNQKQIVTGILMYAQDHEELLPTADAVWGGIGMDKGVLVCPTAGTKILNGYAFNANLSGIALGEITNPTGTAVVGDSLAADNLAYTGPGDLDMRHGGKVICAFSDGHVEISDSAPVMAMATIDLMTGVPKDTKWTANAAVTGSAWSESESGGPDVNNIYVRYNATGGNPGTSLEVRSNGDFRVTTAKCDLTSAAITPAVTLPSPHYWMLAADIKHSNSQGGAYITVSVQNAASATIGSFRFDLPNNPTPPTPITQNFTLGSTMLFSYDRGANDPRYSYKPVRLIGSPKGISLSYYNNLGVAFTKTVGASTAWNTARYVVFQVNSSNTNPVIYASNVLFGSK